MPGGQYDLAVIGGGAAGLAAAIMASTLSARTVVVEKRRLGGECTFTGCVPSKALIHIARLLHDARSVTQMGAPQVHTPTFHAIIEHVRAVRERVYHTDDASPNLERRGIEVAQGRARFTGPHELEITSHEGAIWSLRFRSAVIATGSEPQTLPTVLPCLTNETLFEIDALPRQLVIAGVGPVGIEMAQAFARLGSCVTVVAPDSRILPNDDEECADIVRRVLEGENVRFRLGRTVREYREDGGRRVVLLDDGTQYEADALLAAVGSKPRLDDLGLTAAGVDIADGSLVYDTRCRTTSKHIFVSGDVAGWYRFTHAAEHMSRVAVTNALLHVPATLDERGIAWTTFTDPELAHCGRTQSQLQKSGERFQERSLPYGRIDRAVTDDAIEGLIKVLADRRGRVLGATIVGERAGDVIAEWGLAVRKRLSLRDISRTIHSYPTYALGNKRLADEWYSIQIARAIVPIARTLFHYQNVR